MDWLERVLLPELRHRGVDEPIHIYGSGYPRRPSSAVQFHGYDDDAGSLYKLGDIHLAPILSGAGMNGKVISPLMMGLPVVTTPLGCRGLRENPRLHVCRNSSEFADAIETLLIAPPSSAERDPLSAKLELDDETVTVERALRAWAECD